ncbi:unnamed protein product, partial [Discosporangium mesarthrocarpum]
GGGGTAPSVGSRVSRKSGVSRVSRALSSRGVGRSTGGSGASSRRAASVKNSGGISRGGSVRSLGWQPELKINMLEVRSIQRRLGMYVSVSDLDESFKVELRTIREDLNQQGLCNDAVDRAVETETSWELEARAMEQADLRARVVKSMDRRAISLHEGSQKFCQFLLGVAREAEQHRQRSDDLDERAEEQ